MTYQKHIFFCTNQRDGDRRCCNNHHASALQLYAKRQVAELKLAGAGGVRVNAAGCLGRCKLGPVMVVYPEGVWYNYHSEADVDRILTEHVRDGHVVEALLVNSP